MEGTSLRYGRIEDILQLALDMQGSAEGISFQEIQEKFNVSRRTAERMRDAVLRVFPNAEEVDTGERIKRWRVPGRTLNGVVGFSAEELTELQSAIAVMRRDNLIPQADILGSLASKVRSLVKLETLRRIEPDLEALMEAEGLAMRPGPRPAIRPELIGSIRGAILRSVKIRLHYRARGTLELSRQIVCPYGFLYGNRHYLVAFNMNVEVRDYRLFVLSCIEKVDVTDWPFVRREDFSLETYAEKSFGVFQEDSFDVAWRFTPDVADDAREFLFHPSQTMEDQPDGSLVVRFHAGGAQEMAWHLFTWGDSVEVLEPLHLRDLLNEMKAG
jgi:predicted DNA-binding transcriptional regulator YafY